MYSKDVNAIMSSITGAMNPCLTFIVASSFGTISGAIGMFYFQKRYLYLYLSISGKKYFIFYKIIKSAKVLERFSGYAPLSALSGRYSFL